MYESTIIYFLFIGLLVTIKLVAEMAKIETVIIENLPEDLVL